MLSEISAISSGDDAIATEDHPLNFCNLYAPFL